MKGKAAEVKPCAKTKQEEFLEHYQDAHRAKFKNGILQFCPGTFVKGYACKSASVVDCDDCRRKYWLEEVEE